MAYRLLYHVHHKRHFLPTCRKLLKTGEEAEVYKHACLDTWTFRVLRKRVSPPMGFELALK